MRNLRDNGEELSAFALDVYWSQGRGNDPKIDAHVAECVRCSAYLAELDAIARSAALPPTRADGAATRRAKRFNPAQVAFGALGGLLLAASVALFVSRPGSTRDGYVGTKGAPAVQLLVVRGRDPLVWDGTSSVRPGDSLALRVACEGLAKVAVLGLTTGTQAGAPAYAKLEEVDCVEGAAPLPFTLRIDDEPGDEQLAVVLSDVTLDEKSLNRAIAEHTRTKSVWSFGFVLPKELGQER